MRICAAPASSEEIPNSDGKSAAMTAPTTAASEPSAARIQNDVAIVARTPRSSPRAAYSATNFGAALPNPNSSSSRYSANEPTRTQIPKPSLPSSRARIGVVTSAATAMTAVVRYVLTTLRR